MIHLNPRYSVTGNLEQSLAEGHQRAQTQNALANLLKDNAAARSIAMLPPHMQQQYTQQLMKNQSALEGQKLIAQALGGEEAPQQQAPAPIQNLMEQMQPQQMPQEQMAPVEFGSPIQPGSRADILQMLQGGLRTPQQQAAQQDMFAKVAQPQQMMPQEQFPAPQMQQAMQEPVKEISPLDNAINKAQRRLNQLTSLAGSVDPRQLAPHLDNARDELNRLEARRLSQEKEGGKLSQEERKEISSIFGTIKKEAETAKESKNRLGRMEELIMNGDLPSPTAASVTDALANSFLHLDLTSSLGKDAEEFKKLSNDFVKNAKAYFGAKLTDTDLKTFMKTVPNLTQTNEGKMRVLRNLNLVNDMAILKEKTADEILAENPNIKKSLFERELKRRVDPQATIISEQFKKGMSLEQIKKIPEEGTVLGMVGKRIGKATVLKHLLD